MVTPEPEEAAPSSQLAADSVDGTRKPLTVPLPKHLGHLRRDERGYPVLVTIPQSLGVPDFGMLSDRRKLAAAAFDVCGVCALPFTQTELRWQVAFADAGESPAGERAKLNQHPHLGGDVYTETPLHEICALYAAQVCPFVSSPYSRHSRQTELRGRRRPDSIVLCGYEDTAFVVGGLVGSDLGNEQASVMFVMADRVATQELTSRDEATAAYARVLESEATPLADGLDLEIAAHFARDATKEEEDRTATGLAGGAWIIGAAFAPNLDTIVTLEMFAAPQTQWLEIAVQLLVDPDLAVDETIDSSRFPEVGTALAWFAEHMESLPTPIRRWRERAQEAIATAKSVPPQRSSRGGSDPRKSKRKAARSSRRKNRR